MKYLAYAVLAAAGARQVAACDFCSIYSAIETRSGKGFNGGVAEQFTRFGTLQDSGHVVPNEADQWLNSSISQLFVGYNFSDHFGLQFNAPIIYRSFKRPNGFETDRGTESGIGDVALTGKVMVYHRQTEDKTVILNLLGGVKFPTGDTSRIAEEFNEVEIPGAPESAIHGHDLTLGSGSFDGIVGTSMYARWKRVFFSTYLQYSIRSKGDFDYRFANDFTWSAGPGALLVLRDNFTLSIQANVSGETKGEDTFQNEKTEDTGITSTYIGPEFSATWGDRISAELGVDLPLSIHNTALQAVPDYRIHAALTFRF